MPPPRTTWKGFLKLSLVSCPIRMVPATTRTERVSLHNVNAETRNRVEMRPHDIESGEELQPEDLVKGYELEDGRYVLVEDEELRELRIDSSRTIELDRFVDRAAIDTIYYDSPFFLVPDGPTADETFRVVRAAIEREEKIGIGRVVRSSRERVVAVEPRGRGMMLTTLRAAGEIRAAKEIFAEIGEGKPDRELTTLAGRIIEQKAGRFEPRKFVDSYQKALRALVQAKLRGEAAAAPRIAEPASPVVDLMAALKRSLEAQPPKRPAARKAGGRESRQRERA